MAKKVEKQEEKKEEAFQSHAFQRTFEDVLDAQEELRDTLETFIEENHCLTTEERGLFFRQMAHATLGMGCEIPVRMIVWDYVGYEWFGNAETFARMVASYTEPFVIYERVIDYTQQRGDVKTSIADHWEALLQALFSVFPVALSSASKMSKEADGFKQTNTGGKYGVKKIQDI